MLKKVCVHALNKIKKLERRIKSIDEDIEYLKDENLSLTQITELENYRDQLSEEMGQLQRIYDSYCKQKTSKQYELVFRGKKVEVALVPELLADPLNNFISKVSPLGQKLEDVNEGDVLTVQTSRDRIRYKVSKITTYLSN
ncbi:hypothetical protein GF357_03925 [Candidatus Dojkabacteria bacterium]|nr:hypothetical protein [Candidatus Dojkabacteria bacterium]